MARLFYGSVLGGVLLSVLTAWAFPLPQAERFRSVINVIPDGGREEVFAIDWPADRIGFELAADAPMQMRQAGGMTALIGPGGVAVAAEVFRLRDMSGNVIGLASRLLVPADGQAGRSEWTLLLPGRGNLFLAQNNAVDIAPQAAGPNAGLSAAADRAGFWQEQGTRRITHTDKDAGLVISGTQEFAGLTGSYDEVWELRESTPSGTRGRIVLTTRMQAL